MHVKYLKVVQKNLYTSKMHEIKINLKKKKKLWVAEPIVWILVAGHVCRAFGTA